MSPLRENTLSVQEIIDELKSLGNDATKRTLEKHGAREPFFGVKVEDLKKIQKRIKKDYKLALELYDTGISDAMYLAGLIADDAKMTTKDLQRWAKEAYWSMLTRLHGPLGSRREPSRPRASPRVDRFAQGKHRRGRLGDTEQSGGDQG